MPPVVPIPARMGPVTIRRIAIRVITYTGADLRPYRVGVKRPQDNHGRPQTKPAGRDDRQTAVLVPQGLTERRFRP